MTKSIMIVCGEASGDLHGSNLVKSLQLKEPDLSFCGMGGPDLQSCGVEILYDAEKIAVVGVFEVFSHLKDIFQAQKILRKRLKDSPPDLLIIIDLPDFNLMLARYAKKIGIPVFYYICPQIWAWRTGRVKTLKKRIDKLGVILPFEEDFFLSHGLKATYVGHPLLDSVRTTIPRKEFYQQNGINETNRCVGLLPGSRKREIYALLPIFLKAAEKLQRQCNDKLTFLIPRAATISVDDLDSVLQAHSSVALDVRVVDGDRYNLMASCDCVVAASGTVTLELAILQTPMVVTYKLSPLTYRLAQMLVKLDHFSLVNLIAGFSAVPELLQEEVVPERICHELSLLLNVYSKKKEMGKSLRLVKRALGEPGASQRAAEVARELLST